MKNATKHAEELRSLMKRLVKEHKPEPKQPKDALQALVRAAMSFDMPDAKADEAMRHIEREFVDLNELRVATDLEIQELLGTRYPAIELDRSLAAGQVTTVGAEPALRATFVFTRADYRPDCIPGERVRIIMPSLDPLSTKNRAMAARMLAAGRVEPAGLATIPADVDGR